MKINDGLVLAADSASTVMTQSPQGEVFAVNIYNNANKIFNLRKGLPIGAITWGAGNIGNSSISTLVKDLRKRFSGHDPDHKDWNIVPENYTIEAIANKFKTFVFDELYATAFAESQKKPSIGFIIGGYSSGAGMADDFQIDISNGNCNGPRKLRDTNESGITWAGEPEALNRLLLGFSPNIAAVLAESMGLQPAQVTQVMQALQLRLTAPLIFPAMPLQDAIDLAEFLVDLTIKFSRFAPGAPSVGGPIEIAAVSKHEGFRWIKRKYYFSQELNP